MRPHSAPGGGHFLWLMIALVAMLVAYPWLGDAPRGTALGGLVAVTLLVAGVFAVRTHRVLFLISLFLAIVASGADVVATTIGTRGHPFVESAFACFYSFTTGSVFAEVIRRQTVTQDTIYGVVCVYLMLGVTFGSVFAWLETVHPGSFLLGAPAGGHPLGWRDLIFFSFMTLTTVGYGDIAPSTHVAQSLAVLEAVTGVLFVAVLIARVVGIYGRR